MPSKKRLKKIKSKPFKSAVTDSQSTSQSVKSNSLVTTHSTSVPVLTRPAQRLVETIKNSVSTPLADRLFSTFVSLAFVGGMLWTALGVIPSIYKQTPISNREELARATVEARKKRVEEDSRIKDKKVVVIATEYGPLEMQLFLETVPNTSDNFARLVDRGVYNGIPFHRLVESASFSVLQGGDYENKNGSGGVGALVDTVNDEQWAIAPDISDSGVLLNTPIFTAPEGYSGYTVLPDGQTKVTIKKGYVAMAKKNEPNTATSQFFITLSDVVLPADYTVFGKISDSTLSTLEKIKTEVSPIDETGAVTTDGIPDKPVTITRAILQ